MRSKHDECIVGSLEWECGKGFSEPKAPESKVHRFLFVEISVKIGKTKKTLKQFGYTAGNVSAQEFYDYLTGEIFSDDPTTLHDVLGNEYIMIHELVEISELKKMGRKIDKRVIVDSPKTVLYKAHLTAMETELRYALSKGDTFWAKMRLRQHKESVLEDDPNLPEALRPKAEKIYKKCTELIKEQSEKGY